MYLIKKKDKGEKLNLGGCKEKMNLGEIWPYHIN